MHVLPTERTTFVTFPLDTSAIHTNVEQIIINPLKTEPGRIRLAHPVTHFLKTISNTATLTDFAEREAQINHNPKIADYVKLAVFLETEILRGKIDFDTSKL